MVWRTSQNLDIYIHIIQWHVDNYILSRYYVYATFDSWGLFSSYFIFSCKTLWNSIKFESFLYLILTRLWLKIITLVLILSQRVCKCMGLLLSMLIYIQFYCTVLGIHINFFWCLNAKIKPCNINLKITTWCISM